MESQSTQTLTSLLDYIDGTVTQRVHHQREKTLPTALLFTGVNVTDLDPLLYRFGEMLTERAHEHRLVVLRAEECGSITTAVKLMIAKFILGDTSYSSFVASKEKSNDASLEEETPMMTEEEDEMDADVAFPDQSSNVLNTLAYYRVFSLF